MSYFLSNLVCLFPHNSADPEADPINMKQKIVMKTQMNCEKCRSKALQIVAEGAGVDFVAIEGDQKDKVVVIGDGVDAIKLATSLRRKVGSTNIISISEVKSK